MNEEETNLILAWAHLINVLNTFPLEARGQVIADMREHLDGLYATLLTERKADARSNKNAR